MDSDLGRLGSSLSLTEEEEAGLVVPTELWHSKPLKRGFFVVGRLVTSKSFHPEALHTTLRAAFNPVRLEVDDNPKQVDLSRCDFHIHIHGLPLGKMKKEVTAFIGNKLGQFKDVDIDSKGDIWGSSVRIRASINITQPLKHALKIRMVLGNEHLVTFTYERLLNFCYLCGCLEHLSRQCEVQLQEGFCDPGENSSYGTWLRAVALLSYRSSIGGAMHRTIRDSGLSAILLL
ncbi:hypothetical protein Sango_0248800 [Sesamum angolense]|uniref:Zinc knuckle CX2CX4HX4C domain-containing protein n=1 Tax=Sesamum angolense TaxID=2727404 RepID=A0AAE1XH66_9LAMI|nr:hypothetical protein Sango_0248800 [Sesamum angolense]